MSITTQNWDSGTSGWNLDANMATTTTVAQSSPNSLGLVYTATAGTNYYATYATLDGVSGNAIATAYFYFQNVTTLNKIGLTARCSSANPNNTSTSQYVAYLQANHVTPKATIAKIVSGSETNIDTNVATVNWSPGLWYYLRFTLSNSLLKLEVQRVWDGYWFDGSSGDFLSGAQTAASGTDSSITGQGYWGVFANQVSASQGLYTDDYGIDPNNTGFIRVPMDGLKINSNLLGGMIG